MDFIFRKHFSLKETTVYAVLWISSGYNKDVVLGTVYIPQGSFFCSDVFCLNCVGYKKYINTENSLYQRVMTLTVILGKSGSSRYDERGRNEYV